MSFSYMHGSSGPPEFASDATCRGWLSANFVGLRARPGWLRVPTSLLPDGMIVGWFDALGFMQRRCLQPPPLPDSRPLITPHLKDTDRQEWDRLWVLYRDPECPVCLEKPEINDSPMNSDVPTRCLHWACTRCWAEIRMRDRRCPVCREDLSAWFRNG